ncbi:MAG: hypothetical protein RIT81_46865 [Deltaproteobacteria bacterium]
MSQQEPKWGEPPLGDVVARLIAERYPLTPGEAVVVEVDAASRFVELVHEKRRHHFRFRVRYLRGAGEDRDPWMLMVDALDGLYGMFVESGSHRTLPTGDDVQHDGAFFSVTVEHSVPELEKLADQMLGDN